MGLKRMNVVNTQFIWDSMLERKGTELWWGITYTQAIANSVRDFNSHKRTMQPSKWIYVTGASNESKRFFMIGIPQLTLKLKKHETYPDFGVPLIAHDETDSCIVWMQNEGVFDKQWGYLIRRGHEETFSGIYIAYDQVEDQAYLLHGSRTICRSKKGKKEQDASLESLLTPSLVPLHI